MTTEDLNSKLYYFKAKVLRVKDGDTIIAEVHYGFKGTVTHDFRLIHNDGKFYFDTPETRLYKGVTEEHKQHGLRAKERAEELLLNKDVYIKTYKEGSFRWLAEVWLEDGTSFAEQMINEGYQKKDNYN